MAAIEDVLLVEQAISDKDPQNIVLLEGINNLLRGDLEVSSLPDYNTLLKQTKKRPLAGKIIVLGVIPVRSYFFASIVPNQQTNKIIQLRIGVISGQLFDGSAELHF